MFRIATFNCENLFSRPKLLNIANAKAAPILTDLAKLETTLAKPVYTDADKKKILQTVSKHADYFEITEDRGKLFTGRGAKRRVSATGSGDWDGGMSLKKDTFTNQQRENTAQVIRTLNADVQCLVECEDRPTIDAFDRQMLKSAFPYNILIDSFDPRGIDVGLYSKRPISSVRTHIFDKDNIGRIFSRDCLEVELEIQSGKPLHVLVNHFKSQGYGDQDSNDKKRKRQAERVAEILKGYDLTRDHVVVAGDFNDSPNRAPAYTLGPLLSVPHLSDVLGLKFPNADDRWTYHYKKFEQIDYILISDALKQYFRDAGVERRGIHQLDKLTKGKEEQFPEVTSVANAASDHAAVWADFNM